MKYIYKKKTYQGMIEIKDYELRKVLENKESVKFIFDDEWMVLTYRQLKTQGKVINTQKSIINKGQTYKIIGFDWKPQKDLDAPVSIYNAYAAMPPKIRDEIRAKLGLPSRGGESKFQ